ncbi:MAG: hypothetical protein FWG65_00575, partial [Turicibacter sp.]|nr:hypothetical protein [Turicibacter sp.]
MNPILDFLIHTEPKMDDLPNLTHAESTKLYADLEIAAKALPNRLTPHEAELRTEICIRLDAVLDQIVDTMPTDKQWRQGNIFSPALMSNCRIWQDVELQKDCGLVGYTLAAETDSVSTMYFLRGDESNYPHLKNLPGLHALYSDNAENKDRVFEHLQAHYEDMDVVILYGFRDITSLFIPAYRRLRPDGKIYLALDMNSHWFSKGKPSEADEILAQMPESMWKLVPGPWFGKKHPLWETMDVLRMVDVIATSCTPMRDAINLYAPFPALCRYLSNGFYLGG